MANLFHPELVQWGLRGDPLAWREMREVLRDQPWPLSEGELLVLLRATLVNMVGDAPVHGEAAYVERFARGGMSSGQVSLAFWRDTALPLLCQRFLETTG